MASTSLTDTGLLRCWTVGCVPRPGSPAGWESVAWPVCVQSCETSWDPRPRAVSHRRACSVACPHPGAMSRRGARGGLVHRTLVLLRFSGCIKGLLLQAPHVPESELAPLGPHHSLPGLFFLSFPCALPCVHSDLPRQALRDAVWSARKLWREGHMWRCLVPNVAEVHVHCCPGGGCPIPAWALDLALWPPPGTPLSWSREPIEGPSPLRAAEGCCGLSSMPG